MKKIVSVLLVFSVVFCANGIFASAVIEDRPIYTGDVNEDHIVNDTDLDLVISHLYQFDDFSALAGGLNADVDGNGVINRTDCALIQNIILGVVPVEQPYIELHKKILNEDFSVAYNGQYYEQELITDAEDTLIHWNVYRLPNGLERVEKSDGKWVIRGIPDDIPGEYRVECSISVENKHEYADWAVDDLIALKLVLKDEQTPDEDPDNPEEEEKTLRISIFHGFTSTVNYGKGETLQAVIDGEVPEGATIKWKTSNDNFTVSVSEDGKSCFIKPETDGETEFKVEIVSADGTVLAESSAVTVESNVTLWNRIVAFFERLIEMITKLFK